MSAPMDPMIEYHGALLKRGWVRAIEETTTQLAATRAIVLVHGENGSGKELMARMIHKASVRHCHPFVKINCAGVPADRLESELFGHEKGAGVPASRRRLGRVEFANGGSLFLDAIGEVPPDLQPKLLRMFKEGEFARLGGQASIQEDVQIIGATTQRLEVTRRRGGLWEASDRLKVVDIEIAPLRERPDEIPALAGFFLARFNQQYGRSTELCSETLALFTRYAWRGNVRELETVVERLVVNRNVPGTLEEIHSRLDQIPSPGEARCSA